MQPHTYILIRYLIYEIEINSSECFYILVPPPADSFVFCDFVILRVAWMECTQKYGVYLFMYAQTLTVL